LISGMVIRCTQWMMRMQKFCVSIFI
jgi:hypothetical protein